jgi:hypothetical protein
MLHVNPRRLIAGNDTLREAWSCVARQRACLSCWKGHILGVLGTQEQAMDVAQEDRMLIMEPDGKIHAHPLPCTRWRMFSLLVHRWWRMRRWRTHTLPSVLVHTVEYHR